jgi:hypothetical protein
MQIKIGNLFDSQDDFILVTGNATLRKDGALVMGRGAARQLKDRYPVFPHLVGQYIKDGCYPKHNSVAVYGIILIGRFGLFQVKYNWWEEADLDLIKFSVDELCNLYSTGFLGTKTVSVNYPGIGNGRRNEQDVYPIISKLPEWVSVYKQT